MSFNALFLAHASDADKNKHRSFIETPTYKLFTVLVKDQKEAIEVATKMVKEEHLDSILLCPGFTHDDIAGLVKATGGKVSVCVARGDGPSSRIAMEARKREGL
jgi:hypothetical protein